MLRSLFAGISGLRANQTMLDVAGNNIANANTIGFKSSTVVFQDTLSQIMTGAGAPGATGGGTNPIQVGLGVQVAATAGNFNQGSAEVTGRSTDLMLQGDGFFVLGSDSGNVYTRAGDFAFDANGDLVAPSGKKVLGWAPGDTPGSANLGPVNLNALNASLPAGVEMTSYSIGADGVLRGNFSDDQQRDIASLAIADFVNPAGLEKVGETAFRASANSGPVELDVAGAGRRGTLVGGSLEMSNVDLAAEFTNLILAQRGFQASSRVITTSDQVLEDLVNIKR
jgi:flagellar hook protein FlgE